MLACYGILEFQKYPCARENEYYIMGYINICTYINIYEYL